MMADVYRDGVIHVQARMCKTCIFRPGNLMHLDPGRVEAMVEDEECGDDGCIPCHQHLDGPGQAVCRGFFDKHRNTPLQVAQRLGFIHQGGHVVKKGKEHHLCPACGRRTYRRIRRFPTLQKIDARCGNCYDKNFRPETVVPYDPAQEGTHTQAVGTQGGATFQPEDVGRPIEFNTLEEGEVLGFWTLPEVGQDGGS